MIAALLIAELCAGEFRWSVKTTPLPDDAPELYTTVEELVALPRPKTLGPTRHEKERVLAVLEATVVAYALEADQDVHIVLRGETGATMVAEFPDPRCVHALDAKRKIAKARRELFTVIPTAAHGLTYLKTPVLVQISGAIFFDRRHGGMGRAKNGVELHPVKSIRRVP